jgi:glycosyltransferase involved in cell wall biosynthesis
VAAGAERDQPLSCTVVIPCYNEEGNIEECVRRVPRMGRETEILVVDDGSQDRTAEIASRLEQTVAGVRLISYRPNRGKGHAVKVGFEAARGDVVMILDADMTVIPEELDRFFQPIQEGKAEFVNGTRMLYPMEGGAMKLLNFWGNKMFGILISLIIGQRNTDTLCGTKAMLRRDFAHVPMTDPSWGDFDLIFGAARLKLKTVEVPIHYRSRRAGESKMKAFRHGWKLLKVCWRGLRELY